MDRKRGLGSKNQKGSGELVADFWRFFSSLCYLLRVQSSGKQSSSWVGLGLVSILLGSVQVAGRYGLSLTFCSVKPSQGIALPPRIFAKGKRPFFSPQIKVHQKAGMDTKLQMTTRPAWPLLVCSFVQNLGKETLIFWILVVLDWLSSFG